ncbi:MAG TPA: hypothetical protein VL346_13110 [Acidobacteriaceae bacterium]|jgi:hypothetical protein|nr:hypothetical protein [Acidobacteriaceae bacterium]
MKAVILYRIASVLFLVFAAGHTFGFLSFKAPTQEGVAVLESMNTVHFEAGGRIYSYGGWYRGFGLTITAAFLFQAFLAWRLGTMVSSGASDAAVLGWALFAWQIPGIVLAWIYFGPQPMVLSVVVTAVVGAANWLASSARI